ncbi:glycine-rich domain-containing protein [Aureivirga sp. CE67]|uniref:glycine-rich domain-containing protein n=1 Tax=Aureivirga sp. CE67 TaxID=1788983 RepID=UPI0018C96B6B|nr:hypothetical protein [Aureivirga sp. CE67]
MLHKKYSTKEIREIASKIIKNNPALVSKLEKVPFEEKIDVKELFVEVLKFLFLVGKNNQTLTPSLNVDLAWHEFILFTRTYHQFCDNHFGRYIHHQPEENIAKNNSNFQKTIKLYIITFGEPKKEFWGCYAHSEWESAQCGSCEAI